MEYIELRMSQRIRRPVDVVRSQFFDYQHHIDVGVHKGITMSVLERAEDHALLRTGVKVLGRTLYDQQRWERRPDGEVWYHFVTGASAGGRIQFAFRADGPDAAMVDGALFLPKVGVKRWLAPLLKAFLRRVGKSGIDEDRRDLEERNYQPPITAPGATSPPGA